ncbi:DNA topoisomerase, partial [Staphylococcus aureus]|nr:DNA topoisomerase [Staphylococcus aureus]
QPDAQLSLGPVQTPPIQLVKTRQPEINQFKPHQYFTLSLTVKGFDFQLESYQLYTNKQTLEQLVNNLKNVDGKIKSVATK